jgi:hypothetical protein
MPSRFWLLYLLLIFLYYLQISFPFNLSLGYLTPNYLLFFILAVFYLFPLKNSWIVLLLTLGLLEHSTELPLGLASVVIILILVIFQLIKKTTDSDFLSLIVLPVSLVIYELAILLIAKFYLDLSIVTIGQYIYKIALGEFFFGLIFTTGLIFLLRYFIRPPRPQIQLE